MTIRRKSIFVCLLLVALSLCALNSGVAWTHGNAVKAADASPLQGAAAWQQIKRAGGEASLKAAMAAVGMNVSLQFGGIEQQQKLTASDGASFDYFGSAIALSGDTVVIGARSDDIGANIDQGSAYVFTRTGTLWSPSQKLTADDGATYDNFGFSAAINGDTLVIGAIAHNRNQGAVYVFGRVNGTWTQKQKLTVASDPGLISFGSSVAMTADLFVVGARDANVGAHKQQGAAYVFARSGANWMLQQRITANDGSDNEYFGSFVAISGSTVAVGVPQDDIASNTNQGSVYVFTYNGNAWIEEQKLTASDGVANNQFGIVVALSGDTLAIGAWLDTIGANSEQGSAYIFVRNKTGWSPQQKLVASDGARMDRFGIRLALSGDTVVIGTVQTNNARGAAYVFTRSGTQWSPLTKLAASDAAAGDTFGAPIAMSGNTIAISALQDDSGANTDQGSVYIFTSNECSTLTLSPTSMPNGVVGTPYSQLVTASGGEGTYQFAVSSGALPPGLTLAANGMLSGTPTTVGAYQFAITATIPKTLCSGSRSYTLTIAEPTCAPISLSPLMLPAGQRGRSYVQQLYASGGSAPYSFAVMSGALPPNMSLTSEGYLWGWPSVAGTYYFTMRVTDAKGCTGIHTYALIIKHRF